MNIQSLNIKLDSIIILQLEKDIDLDSASNIAHTWEEQFPKNKIIITNGIENIMIINQEENKEELIHYEF